MLESFAKKRQNPILARILYISHHVSLMNEKYRILCVPLLLIFLSYKSHLNGSKLFGMIFLHK